MKTDRRNAMMLVQTLRAGQLTAVRVPDEAQMPIGLDAAGEIRRWPEPWIAG